MASEHPNKTGASLSESTGAVGSPSDIREHMEVYASCGTLIVTVHTPEVIFVHQYGGNPIDQSACDASQFIDLESEISNQNLIK